MMLGSYAVCSISSVQVEDEFVVEWRALTVSLLDRVAVGVWDRLGVTQDKMPLGSVLEGGTWQVTAHSPNWKQRHTIHIDHCAVGWP